MIIIYKCLLKYHVIVMKPSIKRGNGVPADRILYLTHINYLNELKNKSVIISALCSKSHSLFSRIRTLINIPLILSSGAMTILHP